MRRVGYLRWNHGDATDRLFCETLEGLNLEVIVLTPSGTIPAQLDAVVVYGPYGSLVPLMRNLQTLPAEKRPTLVLFHSEQFPNPSIPELLKRLLGNLRSGYEYQTFYQDEQGVWKQREIFRRIPVKGMRFRYYGDIFKFRSLDIRLILVVASEWTASALEARGFQVICSGGMGVNSDPTWGANLALKRDIPVLWIGKSGSGRRAKLLDRIEAELRMRDVELLRVDGVNHPYVFGEERTRLLNRTKIVLNLLRAPWDENALRFYLAGMNGALVVTEPTLPHTPSFVPGTHIIEAPLENLTDTICYYLTRETERQAIADQNFQLVTREMTFEKSLSYVLRSVLHSDAASS